VKEYSKMRWIIWNEIRRYLAIPYIRLKFLMSGIHWGNNWRVFGSPIIQKYKGSKIRIGDELVMRSWISSNPVAPNHPVFLSTRSLGAEILIGNEFGITGGSIIAQKRVIIGDRVIVGGNCLIADTDFHPLDKAVRKESPNLTFGMPITIGDDVFIGTNSIILKGTQIGGGSIIGAGSIVSGVIPANVVAAGNPAVVIRNIE